MELEPQLQSRNPTITITEPDQVDFIIEPPVEAPIPSEKTSIPLTSPNNDPDSVALSIKQNQAKQFENALATLMWRESHTVRSLFDHVGAIIRHIFYSQGKEDVWSNRLDLLSRLVKRHNVPPVSMHFIKPGYVTAGEMVAFQKIRDFFVVFDDEEPKSKLDHTGPMPQGVGYVPPENPVSAYPPPATAQDDDDQNVDEMEAKQAYKPINIYEWLFYAQEAGLGISETEMYLTMTAILRFEKKYFIDLQRMRFWGKIHGTLRPYYIIECQFKETSDKWYEKPAVLEVHPELVSHKVTVYNPFGTYGVREDFEQSLFSLDLGKFPVAGTPAVDRDQRFKEIMVEECGSGANMFCYYVCNDFISAEWLRLPDVTPEQIRKARFVRRGFTGNLDAKVVTCPTFPGLERNYLRTQIARITHTTTISPVGMYVTPEDEDKEEPASFQLIDNPEFEHPNLHDLLSKNLSGYTHVLPFLLRQGRCTWFDPSPGGGPRGEDDEEAAEEEPEEGQEEAEEKVKKKKLRAKVEIGPPVFTLITEDREAAKDIPAWTARATSNALPQNGVVKLSSNLWLGAMCIVQTDKSENFYVGDGLKNIEFTPFMPPLPQPIYAQSNKLLQHISDPLPAAEEEQRMKREEAETARLDALEDAETGDEGEGETDGDNDDEGETEAEEE